MSSSESSAFEYRRRLPEGKLQVCIFVYLFGHLLVPRTVRFSGDVLNRIDDVADKIESVGSRMRQVESIISDNRMPPQKDQKVEARQENCFLSRILILFVMISNA